jgi:hypothetical protein
MAVPPVPAVVRRNSWSVPTPIPAAAAPCVIMILRMRTGSVEPAMICSM